MFTYEMRVLEDQEEKLVDYIKNEKQKQFVFKDQDDQLIPEDLQNIFHFTNDYNRDSRASELPLFNP